VPALTGSLSKDKHTPTAVKGVVTTLLHTQHTCLEVDRLVGHGVVGQELLHRVHHLRWFPKPKDGQRAVSLHRLELAGTRCRSSGGGLSSLPA
jgi:hypothetical protein